MGRQGKKLNPCPPTQTGSNSTGLELTDSLQRPTDGALLLPAPRDPAHSPTYNPDVAGTALLPWPSDLLSLPVHQAVGDKSGSQYQMWQLCTDHCPTRHSVLITNAWGRQSTQSLLDTLSLWPAETLQCLTPHQEAIPFPEKLASERSLSDS